MTDYSVNSQIITITREKEKWGAGGRLGKWGCASALVSYGPGITSIPSHLPGWPRRPKPQRQRIDRKGPDGLVTESHEVSLIFKPSHFLISPRR